jgi:hypothetical protein
MAFAMQADTDTVQAYLFECDDDRLFAVSIDPHGRNIPRNACSEGRRLKSASAGGDRSQNRSARDTKRRLLRLARRHLADEANRTYQGHDNWLVAA